MSVILLSREFPNDPQRSEAEQRIAAALAGGGRGVLSVPHLYHVAENDALWDRLCSLDRPMVVLSWLQPRAMQWVLARHGIELEGVTCINLAEDTSVDELTGRIAMLAPDAVAQDTVGEATQQRWYPVVDKSRCTDCGHCSEFCLFGVYEIRDGQVHIVQPDRCKPGCPACSRICSQSAIMFPLYGRDPAIAGAPGQLVQVDDAARKMYQQRTGMALDLLPTPSKPLAPLPTPAKPQFTDLDDLVADLESFGKGRRA